VVFDLRQPYYNRAIRPVSWIERIVATTLVARQNLRLRYAYDTTMFVNSHPVYLQIITVWNKSSLHTKGD